MDLISEPAIPLMQLLVGNRSISTSKAIDALMRKRKPKANRAVREQTQSNIVQMLCLLINAGASVEDLCCFSKRKTTPVHVAIDLCQATGNMEIFKLVVKKARESNEQELLLDDDGRTPLHYAATLKFTTEEISAKVFKHLTTDLKIDPTVRDRTVADYLKPSDERHKFLEEICGDFKSSETTDNKAGNEGTDTESEQSSSIEIGEQFKTPESPIGFDRQISIETKRSSQPVTVNVTLTDLKEQLTSLSKKPDEYFVKVKSSESETTSNLPKETKNVQELEIATNTPDDSSTRDIKTTIEASVITAEAENNIAEEVDDINIDHCDDIDFDGKRWKVECNEKVKSCLRSFSKKLRRVALDKLQQIASGVWTRKTAKRVSSDAEIYEARLTKAYRIIWGIAITFSPDSTKAVRDIEELQQKNVRCYHEVIIIHDIVTDHDKIHHSVKVVEKLYSQHQSYASNAMKPIDGESQLGGERMPRLFVNGSELRYNDYQLIRDVLKCEELDADTKMVQQQSIVKYYSVTTSLVMNLLEGKYDRSDDPFKVSDEEYDIITLPETQPVVLLGRSGTGKTTCCLCRMWAKFELYWSNTKPDTPLIQNEHKDQPEHLCQIFIAKNNVLCNRMKRRFYDFVASQQATEKHLSFESAKLPKTLNEVDELAYPLFMTAREFFLLLDNSLPGNPYFDMTRDKIVNSDYATENRRTLMLLDSDESDSEEDDDEQTATNKRVKTEISASYFKDNIWPKYLASHCKDSSTDPLLVWMEIHSFIKGSAKAVDSKKGFLSEPEYVELGKKMAPHFVGNRAEIYKIFQNYCHLKHKDASKHYFDDCDFIYHLYLKVKSVKAIQKHIPSIHQIYIDEVQDFTQAELAVLSKCCSNPNGLFLTGDTAQTIIQGVAFRFEELRSLFYEIMPHNVPEIQRLTINHRSVKGVTQLATSVTDLLTEFFPNSFDRLPDDKSAHEGTIPIFLSSCDPNDFALILKGDTQEIEPIDFGADQAIIVRSEEAKSRLPKLLREGIVLTIFESKGLEFNDVILYDFFSDSQLLREWYAASLYLERHREKIKRRPHPHLDKPHPLSDFNESHHKSLGAELKQLYTAITRAKECIWIYESDEKKRLPMLDYWYRRELVKLRSLESVSKALFPRGSSKEQWKERGDVFTTNGHWELARECYHKAEETLLEKEAIAYLTVQTAVHNKEYYNAVAAFLDCDKECHNTLYLYNAAKCLAKAKDYKNAAILFERLKEFQSAFKVYRRIRDMEGCVRMKEQGKDYRGAIVHLLAINKDVMALETAAKYFDQQLIHVQSVNMPKLTKVACEYALKFWNQGAVDGVKMAVKCISDISEQVTYLKRARLYSEASDLLFANGKHEASFSLLHAQGCATKGYQFALEMEDSQRIYLFTCQAAMMEIRRYGVIKDCDVFDRLIQFSKCNNDLRRGKALILLCRSLCGDENKVTTALQYGEAALAIYQTKLKSIVGEIESFNLLAKLQLQHKKEPLKFVRRALQHSAEAKRMIDVLTNRKASIFLIKQQVQHFYDLEPRRNEYSTAKGQDIWIGSLEKDCLTDKKRDSDGFILLDESLLLNAVATHLKKYVSVWMENSKVKSTITNKLAVFAFHEEVKNKRNLQQSFQTCTENEIQDFLSVCQVAFQTDAIDHKLFDTESLMMNLDKLLTPFSLLYLPLRKKPHFMTLRNLPSFKEHVKAMVNDTFRKDSETDADRWLQAWQMLSILGENTSSMKAKLSKKSAEVNQRVAVKQQRKFVPSSEFVFVTTKKQHVHFFSNWLQSCNLIKEGKVFLAIELAAKMFIETIARRRSFHISSENIVNILSVHTTALLAMISCCSHLQAKSMTLVVPCTFMSMVQSFDELNCQRKEDTLLLQACMGTAQKMNTDRLLQNSYSLLWKFLDILIGVFNHKFNVLSSAIKSSIESSEATHCFILVSVIFGNLALAGYLPQQIESHQKAIAKALRLLYYSKYQNSTNSHVARLQHAYAAFVSCTNTNDLFRSVICKLSDGVGMPEMCELKVVQSLSSLSAKPINILQHRIPAATLPLCKYEQFLPSDVSFALKRCIKTQNPTSRAVAIKKPEVNEKDTLKTSPTKPKDTTVKDDSSAESLSSGLNCVQFPHKGTRHHTSRSAHNKGDPEQHQPLLTDKKPDQNEETEEAAINDIQELQAEKSTMNSEKTKSEQSTQEVNTESEVTSELSASNLYKSQKSEENDSNKQFERLESFPENALEEGNLEEVLQEAIKAVTHEEGEHDSSAEEPLLTDKKPDQNEETAINDIQELQAENGRQSTMKSEKIESKMTTQQMTTESEATSELSAANLAAESYKSQKSEEDDSNEQFERLESFPENALEELEEGNLEVNIDDEEVLQEVIKAVTHEEGEHDSSAEDSDFEGSIDETIVDNKYCRACDEQFGNEDEQKAHIKSEKHKFKAEVTKTYEPVATELVDILKNEEENMSTHSPEITKLLNEAKELITSNRKEIESLAEITEWEASLADVRDMTAKVDTLKEMIEEELDSSVIRAKQQEAQKEESDVDETADDEMSDDEMSLKYHSLLRW